jgi:exopolysaccharide biosynthesis protein
MKFFLKRISLLLWFISLINMSRESCAAPPDFSEEGLSYEVRKEQEHAIHILTVSPTSYTLELVKAHDQVFGRETVSQIALRKGARFALNGGFFEIGKSEDGRPSGTLIIKGNIFGLTLKPQDLLLLSPTGVELKHIIPHLSLQIGSHLITPEKINQFVGEGESALYSCTWGPTTLTPYKNRCEIIIDSHYSITCLIPHGNNPIPPQGFVLSLPSQERPSSFPLSGKVIFKGNLSSDLGSGVDSKLSIVTGIPLLVKEGQVLPGLSEKQLEFYTTAHARTAVGVKANGDMVFVVADNTYTHPLKEVTLEQALSLLYRHKVPLQKTTIAQAKEILKEKLRPQDAALGLTIPQLAQLMVDLGCQSALNLDGGGSSTLFINGKIVNNPMGDKDEGMSKYGSRPVSDAIVLIPLKKK